jgi:hypothetical protein
MFTDNEKRPLRLLSRRITLIGGLLFFLLGGLYWQLSATKPFTPVVARELQPIVETAERTPDATITATTEADSAQSLPIDLVVNKPVVFKRMVATTLTKVRPKVDDMDIAVSLDVAVPAEREVVMPVAQPVVAPVAVEVRPKVAEAIPVAQPVELKPVVQPIPVAAVTAPLSTSVPMPLTASAVPVPKRKSKNDEDVEIDPQ